MGIVLEKIDLLTLIFNRGHCALVLRLCGLLRVAVWLTVGGAASLGGLGGGQSPLPAFVRAVFNHAMALEAFE